MKKFLLQIILTFIPLIASASQSDIYAVVDDHPITKFDFDSRKHMLVQFNNIDISNTAINAQVNQRVINNLIEDELLRQHAKKSGIKVLDSEVKGAIEEQELMQGMKVGQIKESIEAMNVRYNDYFENTRVQLIKRQLLSSISSSFEISDTEIDSAIESDIDNFNVEAWIFTAKSNDRKIRKKMERFRKGKIRCDKIDVKSYNSFADAEIFKKESVKSNETTATVIRNTKVGEFSPIYKENGKLKLLSVCKKFRSITAEHVNQITNSIINKKVNQKFAKFFHDLRAKSYIKIMLP